MLARVKLICPEVEQVSEVANGPLVDIVAADFLLLEFVHYVFT